MIRIRPYKSTDDNDILSWCQDERAFYQWTAGVMGNFPITDNEFKFVENLMPFTAFDEDGILGFFTFRNPNELVDELRLGFVIVSPSKRGRGCGKAILQLGLKYAFDIYGAKKVSLGVFENNAPAYYCYKAVGFDDVILDEIETYSVLGEEWNCKELRIEKK
ncbi:MAG: GNAT family N-acetyltransferase [Lachnospiraceae bacterium]|nr:GNAT family N-acetyltransferase [Lachnospiraceae bacterium]